MLRQIVVFRTAVALTTALTLVNAVDARAQAPVDPGWPRSYTTATGASVVFYQPQMASWDQLTHAVFYAAVSYTARGEKSALGTIKVESETSVALDERLVSFADYTITESNFTTLPREQLRNVIADIASAIPLIERVISLDRILADLDQSQLIPRNMDGVKAEPPVIFFSTKPAVLLNIDGAPIWSPINGTDLQFAVNTNWDLFQQPSTRTLYARVDDIWLRAPAIDGPWTFAGALPAGFAKLPNDANWQETKHALPGRKISPSQTPRLFASTVPAELILLRGAPTYSVVPGTGLLSLSNTDSDVFRVGKTGPVYYLVSGRWFSAPDFSGPWTFATPTLPDDFKKIPLDHARSHVLASVPGTRQAAEAVLLAGVPQTATVDKGVKAPEVGYQGQPQFEPIEKTSVSRAVNTDKDVIKVGDLYYMCFQGVWFMSHSATGPWTVADSVPKAIYDIPISSPAYSVTYVTVQQATPTTVVYVTSAPYTGVMIGWGCVVWGTGYHYPPYIYRGGPYPIYYPFYPTYGFYATYNPWTGTYARGAVAYGPYGGAGMGARYNPITGRYSRGAVAYGPYGARGAARSYNPRTGTFAATRQGSNVYSSWGQTGVRRGDQWATTSRYTNKITGTTTRKTETSGGATAITRSDRQGQSGVVVSGSGDVYAGHDGNVYRKTDEGWQKHENGTWSGVQPRPTQFSDLTTTNDLNRAATARAEGARRTRDSRRVRAAPNARSYRPAATDRHGEKRR
jgi:hypothetical protein